MAKLDDSLLSGSRGRTGRLVVANVNGIEVLKVRPRKSTKAVSAKQELIRERMKKGYEFIASYKTYVSEFFGTKVGMKSPYNQAMSVLLNAFKLDYAQMEINITYPGISFSRGPLPAPQPTGISSAVAQQITVDWYNNSGGNADRDADELQVLCAVEGEPATLFFQNQGVRLDEQAIVTLPPMVSGKTVHVYLAFRDVASLTASASAYVGSVTVL
ncbi:DUF6266 family protein [Chryseobacterium caseinilyticum]|uniref:Capsid protein n=1 Tax=Chryseobacterium caseinilyticum TaxID=2771428 RepID=A0ABR8Z6J3_9FLAO|nr:DUF6266 family protein [Chryseobacterium caseinilyticum]MBD8080912.1 hypothetical protein [Chryseobacterium caseinilyticum]